MRIAAIDLGSNTFHLLIAQLKNGKITELFKTNNPVKLSENITHKNCIIPAAYARGLDCLKEFKSILSTYNVNQVKAVATSAVRSAENGEQFILDAFAATGIAIEIISGDQEAQLIYQGVKASGVIQDRSLVMDIGGGSTEFIFCDQHQLYWRKSYDIGAARLMQKFFHSDPLAKVELQAIHAHLDEILAELIAYNQTFNAKNLIGSAGAFETYLQMSSMHVDLENLNSAIIPLAQYRELSHKLINATHQQRAIMPNLIPLRVDMIVMACVLTDYVLNNLNLGRMYMTTNDLKYGLLNDLI